MAVLSPEWQILVDESFPLAEFDLMHSHSKGPDGNYPRHLIRSWIGIAYRYRATVENSADFKQGLAEQEVDPFLWERPLCEFFTNGQSAIECFAFAAYSIAYAADSSAFSMSSKKDLRNIGLEQLKRDLESSTFSDSELTRTVVELSSSQEFRDWKGRRNYLGHRSAGGRNLFSGNEPTTWGDFNEPLNPAVTDDRVVWLRDNLAKLMSSASQFAGAHST